MRRVGFFFSLLAANLAGQAPAYRITHTTMAGSRTMGLDPTTHAIFLAGAKFEPLPPGAPPRRRPTMAPGTFVVLVVERQ